MAEILVYQKFIQNFTVNFKSGLNFFEKTKTARKVHKKWQKWAYFDKFFKNSKFET